MLKKSFQEMEAIYTGAQMEWDRTETVTVKDAEGGERQITVRAGMPLADIFDLVMEVAATATTEGKFSTLFCDMILAQGILDRMTDVPLQEDPGQFELDLCYELVFGYNGILRRLDEDGPARYLIDKVIGYTESMAKMIASDPGAMDIDEDELGQELLSLEDLKNMGPGRA